MVLIQNLYTLAGLMASCLFVAYLSMAYTNQLVGASQVDAVEAATSSVLIKNKRLDLVQRAHDRPFFSFASKSQAERTSALREMSQRENGRLAFIKAKLGMSDSDPFMQSSISSLETPLYSGQIVNSANYIVKVGLGSPAHELTMVIDTGSDLAWTQCLPCSACYDQRSPFFDPTASSSYKQVPCTSDQCVELRTSSVATCSGGTSCEYEIDYLDGSFTMGDFAVDALSLNNEVVAAAYPFGCGHDNQGLFRGFDGLLGLSRNSLAFPAQTKPGFGGVFAYCMPPVFSTSTAGYIEFGTDKRRSGSGVSTPLVTASSLYVVELESIEVEGAGAISKPSSQRLVVVDSGTVITRLDKALYTEVRDAIKKATSLKEAPESAGMGFFESCYSTRSASEDIALLFPTVTFTFKGGLAFTLPAQNLVVKVDDNGTYCLALFPFDSSSGVSILGNYQQQRHLFTFDIASSTLSISSDTRC